MEQCAGVISPRSVFHHEHNFRWSHPTQLGFVWLYWSINHSTGADLIPLCSRLLLPGHRRSPLQRKDGGHGNRGRGGALWVPVLLGGRVGPTGKSVVMAPRWAMASMSSREHLNKVLPALVFIPNYYPDVFQHVSWSWCRPWAVIRTDG